MQLSLSNSSLTGTFWVLEVCKNFAEGMYFYGTFSLFLSFVPELKSLTEQGWNVANVPMAAVFGFHGAASVAPLVLNQFYMLQLSQRFLAKSLHPQFAWETCELHPS